MIGALLRGLWNVFELRGVRHTRKKRDRSHRNTSSTNGNLLPIKCFDALDQ